MINQDIVKKFLSFGISVIPVTEKKIPSMKYWKKYQSVPMQEHELDNFNSEYAKGLAIVAGKVSGNLEMIDIDSKYDITGTMYDDYVNQIPQSLFEKLIIQKTVKNGYHIIYRCSEIEGNQKLAQRPTTEEERAERKDEKVKVLFETRGEGGYFLTTPSVGYKVIQGKFSNIHEISVDERNYLLELARSFNTYIEPQYEPKEAKAFGSQYSVSPFEDYNNRCDVVSLMCEHGWSVVRQKGRKTLLKRPGTTDSLHSAEYDADKNYLCVFSTSTEFDALKGYRPYAVYAVLNGIMDWSEVSRNLVAMGYGIKNSTYEKKKEQKKKLVFNDEFDDDGDISFISLWSEIRKKQEAFIDGRIPIGLTTGYPDLDKHFLFKRGNLVMVNGFDNVGKTVTILWLMVISSILHGWKWAIYSAENSDVNIMNVLTQYFLNKPIRQTNVQERNEAQTFMEKHFFHIKPDELLNYEELKLKLVKLHSYIRIDGILIDPYNALDVSKVNSTHDFNYAVLTDMKLWGRKEDVSIWVNNHAVTSALRAKDEDGYTKAPDKGDTEGGAKFPNKADDWLTLHRITNHSDADIRKITEIHVRKIKDTMTGGSQTAKDEPVRLVWANMGSCFLNKEGVHPFKNKMTDIDFEDVINQNAPF
jgi:hypothetical protein